MISAIESLIRRTENAVDETPHIDDPTESIGEGPAWTGARARETHDEHLAPLAEPVKSALNNLVGDVEAAKNELDPEVTESVAQVMRFELEHGR
ncbi:hypothetical protein [Phytoactinopolyspora halophila]|nr:hypothetical protein [Phytoactinopolyspora halophila]